MYKLQSIVAAALLVAAWPGAEVTAQTYPAKPITIVAPASAGGTPDVLIRQLASSVTRRIGQPFVIENRPGAGGITASETVARARPDGYTLLLNYLSHVTNPAMYSRLPYDTAKAFAPVVLLARAPFVLVAGTHVPANTLAELIDYARKNPGKLEFGSPALGGSIHLGFELLKKQTGIDIVMVPYKAGTSAIQDLLSGRIALAQDSYNRLRPFVQEGRMKVMGITSPRRASQAPEVPAIAETVAGFESVGWYGLMAPAGTPPGVVALLNREFNAALAIPEEVTLLAAQGFEPGGESPEAFGALLEADAKKWGALIRDAGLKAE